MTTASCVVHMGKKKLEIGIEDQKISFELFDEEKHLSNQNVCLQVKEYEKEVMMELTNSSLVPARKFDGPFMWRFSSSEEID